MAGFGGHVFQFYHATCVGVHTQTHTSVTSRRFRLHVRAVGCKGTILQKEGESTDMAPGGIVLSQKQIIFILRLYVFPCIKPHIPKNTFMPFWEAQTHVIQYFRGPQIQVLWRIVYWRTVCSLIRHLDGRWEPQELVRDDDEGVKNPFQKKLTGMLGYWKKEKDRRNKVREKNELAWAWALH